MKKLEYDDLYSSIHHVRYWNAETLLLFAVYPDGESESPVERPGGNCCGDR